MIKIKYVLGAVVLVLIGFAANKVDRIETVTKDETASIPESSETCPPPAGGARAERTISSEAIRCEEFFKASKPAARIFSNFGLQKFKGPKKRMMIYDYKAAASGKKTMLLIHGLGDDMFSLQRIAERAEADGYGILRIDLHGHGKTLEEYLANNEGKLPDEYDFRENVDDVKKLVRQVGAKDLVIVGHSYGGGIALKLSEELPKKLVYSVHAMAPYVQRIDKYIMDRMKDPSYLITKVEDAAQKAGAPKPLFTIMDPLVSLTWKMTRPFKVFQDLSNAMLGLDKMKDVVMDPAMKGFLVKAYRSYFLKSMNKTEADLSSQDNFFLSARVEAAILVTKGVRGLDYLVTTAKLGKFPKIVQVIRGAEDKLVVPDQMKQFSMVLSQAGIIHEMIQMEGPDSTHLFPQTMPDQVYDLIHQRILSGPPPGAE